jgi:hypothetical protein
MSERAAWEPRDELETALAEAQRALREVHTIAVDGDGGRIADTQDRCDAIEEVTRVGLTRRPVGDLWPGTIFAAGGREFFLVSNRGDKVFGARIEGGLFDHGVSFPKSYPVTVVDDRRAVEQAFWERGAHVASLTEPGGPSTYVMHSSTASAS